MLMWADMEPLSRLEYQQNAMNKLIAGQSENLNMNWPQRWLVARGCRGCLSKKHKDTWTACEPILAD